MTDNRRSSPTLDRETTRQVGKLLLGTLALVVFLSLAWLLPGIGRVVPGTPVTFVAVLGAIVTVAVVSLLLFLAPALASLVRSILEGPEQVVDDVADIVQVLVVFVAIIVAHRGLAAVIVPLLGGFSWMYDLVFLALAVPPLVIAAARVYVSLDPMAQLLADRVS
ncbi:hypothetical protein ACYJ1Y_03375 [Natrialbaceae archaeon A-gly3]